MGIDTVASPAPAVFLDRDGVLNRAVVRGGKPYPPASRQEVALLPGVAEALNRLKAAGFVLVGVTNQPDVARGNQTRLAVEEINAYLLAELPIREIFVCYHDDDDHCDCRKPRPGLILQAAQRHSLKLEGSWLVGDRWKDIAAGHAAGLRTIFVDYHYAEDYLGPPPEFRVMEAGQMADIILRGEP